MTPVLSVVVPVRDVAPWIEEQLDCILRQDVDLEVIVIDDGSVDGTDALVGLVASRDARVTLLRAPTNGGAAARNQGIESARGEYLVFADGDDLVPDGAYRALVGAAETSGAPVVVGRHLKFSSGATWEPMTSWYDVERSAVTTLDDMPSLLANRACWNRLFRTEFLRANGIRFPEVVRSNDIVPVVRALVAAPVVALVPRFVYLYRERPGTSSMTARATSISGVLSYIGQELEVARVLAASGPHVRREHARVVLDADGYVHLERMLRDGGSVEALAAVVPAVRSLIDALPSGLEEGLRVERRVVWHLLARGAVSEAVDLVTAIREAQGVPGVTASLVAAWGRAVVVVGSASDERFVVDPGAVVRDGPLVLLANRADRSDDAMLAVASEEFAPLARGVVGGTELLEAVLLAVRARDVAALRTVSAVRHLAPLVVDAAESTVSSLAIAGPLRVPLPALARAEFVLTGADQQVHVVDLVEEGARWSAVVHARDLPEGRHEAALRLHFHGTTVDFPAVTARMPLPPVGARVPLQPLADRADGWRFLVQRKPRAALRRRVLGVPRRLLRRLRG